MSQEEQINTVLVPTIYIDDQEMLKGNGGSELVPQPQLGMPIQGVQDEGQDGVCIEEPFEAVILDAAKF